MKKYLRKIAALLPKAQKFVNKRQIAIHLRRFLFVFFVILIGVLLQFLVLVNRWYIEARNEYAKKHQEYMYWVSVASQFPNVPDVLYNAAVGSISMGKTDEGMQYVEKALRIDPLFKEAIDLRENIKK